MYTNLLMTPDWEGLQTLWRTSLEFEMVLTNWRNGLKLVRGTEIKTSTEYYTKGGKNQMHKYKLEDTEREDLGLLCRKGSRITVNHHFNKKQN